MTELVRRLLEVFLAGVFLIIVGNLLEPVLAFNLAAFGWLLIFAGVLGAVILLGLAAAQVSNNLS